MYVIYCLHNNNNHTETKRRTTMKALAQFYIDEVFKNELKARAREDNVNWSEIVRRAIRLYLNLPRLIFDDTEYYKYIRVPATPELVRFLKLDAERHKKSVEDNIIDILESYYNYFVKLAEEKMKKKSEPITATDTDTVSDTITDTNTVGDIVTAADTGGE